MPKEYFSLENTTSLNNIPAHSKIHIIGVCGVAMAQLACSLADCGFQVSGSDIDFYEPMGTLLRNSPVKLMKGYSEDNIPSDVGLVIIGNAISYGNPEVNVIEERGFRYSLFPKVLSELVIGSRHSIVISGTHGKTTTTAMGAVLLETCGQNPGYFLGGIANDLPQSLHCGNGGFSIVEGDEYDSAFFAKLPKFLFYRPKTLIITSVEFDHADIYPNLEVINEQFTKLVSLVPPDGSVIACSDSENLKALISNWRKISQCKILTYGVNEGDFQIISRSQGPDNQVVHLRLPNGEKASFSLKISGQYNALNAASLIAACFINRLDIKKACSALASFNGVKRRQQIRYQSKDNILIEDFAHHPTAVRETLLGIKEEFPGWQIFAVFEPRSNTSRRKVFQKDYVDALRIADRVLISDVIIRHNDQGIELLNIEEICNELKTVGIRADVCPNPKETKEFLLSNISKKQVIVMMSNGSFDGIVEDVEKELHHILRIDVVN